MATTTVNFEDLSKEEQEVALQGLLVDGARAEDSPEAFRMFYTYITRSPMPAHAWLWINEIYASKRADKGTLIFAFRGSWKTTTISILFTCWRMGKDPHKANLVLQNNDNTAQNTTLAIADIIEKEPRFRDIFPDVVPDKQKGWGAQGYWIIDRSKTEAEWAELTNVTKDPSLLGLGITSGSVIGKHPTGVLLLDDIHDERNTVSETERAKVVKMITDTVLPMAVEDATKQEGERLETWTLTVGTPWHEEDSYHYLRETGEFGFVNSPLLTMVDEGAAGAVYIKHKQLDGWFRLNWPTHIPVEGVKSLYNKSGHRGFGRMYLLSLIASNELGLPFHSYPADQVPDRNTGVWSAGVDYASMLEIRGKVIDPKNRSKFALASGVILNGRVAVIAEGIVGHYSQLKCEGHVTKIQNSHEHWRTTAVEMNGKGEEFYSVCARNQDTDLYPFWVSGKKEARLEMQLGPWLEMGKIMISDEDTPFLNAVRKALWEFPHGNLDVLDALFAYAKSIPEILNVDKAPESGGLNRPGSRKKAPNPFGAFGRRKYASNAN